MSMDTTTGSVYPSNPKKPKDNELLIWAIVGGLFTGLLICMDFNYSSVNEMALFARIGIWVGHGVLSLLWIVSFATWKDPVYEYIRRVNCLVAIVLCLIIGIHHATSVEDKQVIIDSRENATKP